MYIDCVWTRVPCVSLISGCDALIVGSVTRVDTRPCALSDCLYSQRQRSAVPIHDTRLGKVML